MANCFDKSILLETLDLSKWRIPIIFFYPTQDEIYSLSIYHETIYKLWELDFNLIPIEGQNLKHDFTFQIFEILKQGDFIHYSMINGHWVEYRPDSFIWYVIHPLREHLNTLIMLHGS